MVIQRFECSQCRVEFEKGHSALVMWTACPYCGDRAYPVR